MKATMSTAVIGVSLAQQSSPAAFSDGSDQGFSEVLSGVHTQQAQQGAVGSVRKEDASYAETAETSVNPGTAKAEAPEAKPISENAQTGAAENVNTNAEKPGDGKIIATFTDGMEYRAVRSTVSVSLEVELTELVIALSNGDEDEEGKVIDALLEILRKMQQEKPDKDGDEAFDLVMQLLVAMLGGQETESTALQQLSVRNISEEMSVICGVYRGESEETSTDLAFGQDAGVKGNAASSEGGASAETAQDDPSAQSALEAQELLQEAGQPVIERTPEAFEAEKPRFQIEPEELVQRRTTEAELPTNEAQTELPEAAARIELPEAAVQTELPETAEQPVETAQPIETARQEETFPQTAERLLSDILDKARRELGLTKAEFTAEPKTAEARTEDRLPKTEESAADENRPDSGEQNPRFSARELFLSPNHKDGRSELERILDGGKEQHFDPNAAIPNETVRETELPLGNEPKTDAIPIERQLSDELLARSETVNGGRSEFTMVLNPESLGRITVRLISAGGRVQVSIAAENDATRQLLESRSDHIGAALKNNGVELERYQVVSGREEAQLMQDNYDGSSRNPYGHREEPAEEQPADDGEDFLEILQQL